LITVQNRLKGTVSLARRSDHSREQLHQLALSAARAIVVKEGLRGLSTRRIATILGYSPGTLYQLFADIDDIIMQLNSATLEGLFLACVGVDFSDDPEQVLDDLAARYIQFVGAHPQLWSALFEHKMPRGKALSEQ
jgi:AcrR family transcriptional regulator